MSDKQQPDYSPEYIVLNYSDKEIEEIENSDLWTPPPHPDVQALNDKHKQQLQDFYKEWEELENND